MPGRIAVVGAGIAGASVAAHLADRSDREVLVLDRGEVAAETTARSVALFGDYGTPTERRLKAYGRRYYSELLTDRAEGLRYDHLGRLLVATTEDGAAALAARATDAPGFVAYRTGADLPGATIIPEFDADAIRGALHRPHVGTLAPRATARAMLDRARGKGVRVETHAAVERPVVDGDRVTHLVVDGESVAVGAVVLAAGPWSPALADDAGLSLPVHHSRAPVLVLEPSERPPRQLPNITHHETGVYVRGTPDGRVLVGHSPRTTEPGTRLDPGVIDIREDRRREMLDVVAELLPPLAEATVVEERIGVRSHTPDGDPIVGWTAVEGLSVIAFNSSGIQLAPGAGSIIARQLVDDDPTEFYGGVSISRFPGYSDTRQN